MTKTQMAAKLAAKFHRANLDEGAPFTGKPYSDQNNGDTNRLTGEGDTLTMYRLTCWRFIGDDAESFTVDIVKRVVENGTPEWYEITDLDQYPDLA